MISDRCLSCLSVCLFVTLVYFDETVERIKMKLGTKVGVGPGDFVLDGDPPPPQKKGGHSPQFSAHFYCDQTGRWIKMPLRRLAKYSYFGRIEGYISETVGRSRIYAFDW